MYKNAVIPKECLGKYLPCSERFECKSASRCRRIFNRIKGKCRCKYKQYCLPSRQIVRVVCHQRIRECGNYIIIDQQKKEDKKLGHLQGLRGIGA